MALLCFHKDTGRLLFANPAARTLFRNVANSDEVRIESENFSWMKEGGLIGEAFDATLFDSPIRITLLENPDDPTSFLAFLEDLSTEYQLSEALRRAERRTEELMRQVPGVVFQLIQRPENDLHFDYFSSAAFEIFDLPHNAFLDSYSVFEDLLTPRALESWRTKLQTSIHTGADFTWQGDVYLGDGTHRLIQARVKCHRQEDTERFRWDGIFLDVTHSQQVEKELEEKGTLLEQLLENVDVLVLVHEPQGKVLLANRAFRVAFDLMNTQPVGKSLSLTTSKEVESLLEENSSSIFLSRVGIKRNSQVKLPSGKELHFQILQIPLAKKDSTPYAICTMLMDVTSEIEQKEKIQEVKERLRLALESANMGAWEWIPASKHLIWDEALYKMYGFNAQSPSLLWEQWKDSIHPDDLKVLQDLVLANNTSETHHQLDIRVTLPDKQEKIQRLQAKVHVGEDGKAKKIVGVSWDITEVVRTKKLLEEERARSIYATKMATLGEMSGGIAHEINNPLTIIRGQVLRLQRRAENNESVTPQEMLTSSKKIGKTIDRIASIVRGLRSFAREGSGDPFQDTQIEQMINDCLDLCSTRFKNKNVDLIVEPFDKQLHFECRSVQISQVLLNVLNNALDAVENYPSAWVKLSVKLGSKNVEFRITDCGNGIPPEIVDKIMQPFFTTKEVGKGTGLGLSVSHGIIQSHGGKFFVDTKCKNTCFVIELPRIQQVSPSVEKEAS